MSLKTLSKEPAIVFVICVISLPLIGISALGLSGVFLYNKFVNIDEEIYGTLSIFFQGIMAVGLINWLSGLIVGGLVIRILRKKEERGKNDSKAIK